MVHAGHHRLEAMRAHRFGDRFACRSPPPRGRGRPRRAGARPGRSSARRRCRPAACPAGGSRPCGRGSGSRWTSDWQGVRKRARWKSGKRSHWKRPYRCCNAEAKDLVSARFDRPVRAVAIPTDGVDGTVRRKREQGAYGFQRSQQAARRIAGNLFSSSSRSAWCPTRCLPRRRPEKPGFIIEATEPTEGGPAAPAAEAKPIADLLHHRQCRSGRCRLQEMPGLPFRRKGRPEQGRPGPLGPRRPSRRRA